MTPGNTPVTNTKRTNKTRKIVTSIPKYSANPAITPASVPSSGNLCSFFIPRLYQIDNSILRVLARDDFAFAKSRGEMGTRSKYSGRYILQLEFLCRPSTQKLPSKMCECFVGFGHSMRRFFFCYCNSFTFVRRSDFIEERFVHWLSFCAFRRFDNPSKTKCEASLRPHFARDLIVRSSDASASDFNCGRCFLECVFQNRDWISVFFQFLHHLINDLAGRILFAPLHYIIDELRNFK